MNVNRTKTEMTWRRANACHSFLLRFVLSLMFCVVMSMDLAKTFRPNCNLNSRSGLNMKARPAVNPAMKLFNPSFFSLTLLRKQSRNLYVKTNTA